MKKNSSKLIIAIALVLVSAVMLSTASYAWFTMQKEASVQKFNLTATAPTSIQIVVGHNVDPTSDAWKSTITFDSTNLKAFKPASSVDGIDMYNIKDETKEAPQDLGTNVFVSVDTKVSETEDGYYLDIPLSFRTLGNTDVENLALDVTGSNIALSDNGGTKEIYKAVRVAFLNESGKAAVITGTNNVWAPITNGTVNGTALKAAESTDAVSSQLIFTGKTAVVPKLNKGDGSKPGDPTKITVRIWIEGQDTFCKSLNAGGSFSVSLKFIEATNP